MKTSYSLFAAILICPCLGVNMAWAEGEIPSEIAQHQTMTPQEYEAYRTRLQNQIEQAAQSPQNKVESNAAEVTQTKPDTGYGQGYRARAERSDRAARMSGDRGGAMQRGGGRNR
ncbi:MAG: hypothetical protein PXX77_09885 [Gallionella sp.]|nr:hypothetical protein [Gallionella sp.]